MSTEQGATFRPDAAYRLSPHCVVRRESFGGLAYDLGSRRLLLLGSDTVLDILESLEHYPSAGAAVAALAPGRESAALSALADLERGGLIHAAT